MATVILVLLLKLSAGNRFSKPQLTNHRRMHPLYGSYFDFEYIFLQFTGAFLFVVAISRKCFSFFFSIKFGIPWDVHRAAVPLVCIVYRLWLNSSIDFVTVFGGIAASLQVNFTLDNMHSQRALKHKKISISIAMHFISLKRGKHYLASKGSFIRWIGMNNKSKCIRMWKLAIFKDAIEKRKK